VTDNLRWPLRRGEAAPSFTLPSATGDGVISLADSPNASVSMHVLPAERCAKRGSPNFTFERLARVRSPRPLNVAFGRIFDER
jgi:hypothetical protein